MKMSRGCKIQLSGVGVCLFILSVVCLFIFSGSSFAGEAQGVSSDSSAVLERGDSTPVTGTDLTKDKKKHKHPRHHTHPRKKGHPEHHSHPKDKGHPGHHHDHKDKCDEKVCPLSVRN